MQHFGQQAVWTIAYPFGDAGWKSYAQAWSWS
jgi:hypothetical protein